MSEIAAGATRTGRRAARTVALLVWLGASGVQVAVWVLVCAIGQRLVSPWWLWTVAGGGLVVAALWWLTRPRRTDDQAKTTQPRGEENQPW
jgi:hypothetical protein